MQIIEHLPDSRGTGTTLVQKYQLYHFGFDLTDLWLVLTWTFDLGLSI